MDAQRLTTHLTDPNSRLYAILDGAAAPDLVRRIFKSGLPNYCLFEGDLEPDVANVAPYLVHLPGNDGFSEWVFGEGFGKNWGIFVRSGASMIELRRHFRGLVT